MKKVTVIKILGILAFGFVVSGAGIYVTTTQAEAPTGLTLTEGASVKYMYDAASSGVRFNFKLTQAGYKSVFDESGEFVDGVSVGAILAPQDILKSEDISLTLENASAENSKLVKRELTSAYWIADTEGYSAFVYLYDFPSEAFNREISIVGYMKNGTNISYTTVQTRSMAYVAKASLDAGDYPEGMRELLEGYLLDYQVEVIDGDSSNVYTVKYGSALSSAENYVEPAGKFGCDFGGYEMSDGTVSSDGDSLVVRGNLSVTAVYNPYPVQQIEGNYYDFDLSSAEDYTIPFTYGTAESMQLCGNSIAFTQDETGITIGNADVKSAACGENTLAVVVGKEVYKFNVTIATKVITTRQDLIDFRTLAAGNAYGGYYVLGADIDMQNYEWQNWCGYYKTDGAVSGTNFSGTFDGRGYSISNLKIYMSAYTFSSNGFIGALGSTGVLKNVAFINYGLVCSEVGCYPIVLVGENAGLVENVYLEMDASTRITGSLTDAIHIFGTTGAGRYKNVFVNITGTPTNGNEMVVTRAAREYSFENVILIGQNLTNDANKSGTTATTYESVEAFSQANVDLSGFDDTVWDISGKYPVFRNYIWYIQIEGNYYDFDLSSAEDYAVPFTYGTAESVKLGGVSVAFTQNGTGITIGNADVKSAGCGENTLAVVVGKEVYKFNVTIATKVITTRQDLIDFRTLAAGNAYGGYYVLGADIDMQNYEWQNWCGYYKTDGAVSGTSFSGTFDGRGYSISNLKIYMSAYTFSSNGFIGALGSTGVLKNVAFINYGLVCSEVGCYPIVLVGENAGLVENVYLEMDASTRITGSLTDAIHIFGTTGAGRYKNVFVHITGTPANGNEMVVTRATREYSFENVILIGQNLTNDANKSGTTATTYENAEAFSQANVDLSGFAQFVQDLINQEVLAEE